MEFKDKSTNEREIWTIISWILWSLYVFIYIVVVAVKFLFLLIITVCVDGCHWLLTIDMQSKIDLRGKRAVICGVEGKFGRQLAEKLARRGVTLILWDSDQQLVEEAIEFLQQRGVNRVRGENVQFWSETEMREKALETINDYGRVDFLIFNFLDDFVQPDGFLANKRHFQLVKRSSLTADSIVNVTRAFLPFMLKEETGHVLAITSIAGLFGSATQPRCSALAHSVVGVMKSLEFELESSGSQVKSSLICSSFLKNDDLIDDAWIFPLLNINYVTEQLVETLESNQHFKIVPLRAHFAYGASHLLPNRLAQMLTVAFNRTHRWTTSDLCEPSIERKVSSYD
ncbi:Estradiol 17-beta-dehydrogenase 11-like, protein [Aphelenchoides besseyi]|nr:Estradiol 17-beta-dehydrogenase 11-like, protein [Aphelenchoides besseyi]